MWMQNVYYDGRRRENTFPTFLKLLRNLTRKYKKQGGCYKDVVLLKAIANNQQPNDPKEENLCPLIHICVHQH